MSEQRGTPAEWATAQRTLAGVDPLGTTRLTADVVETHDPAAARDAVTRMLHSHAIDVIGTESAFGARFARARLGPVDLIDVSYGSGVRLRRAATDAYCAVVIPLQGRIGVRVGDEMLVAEPYKTMVVLGDHQDLDSEWQPEAHALILKIERAALDEELEVLDHGHGGRVSFETTMISGASGFALYGAVQLLAQAVGPGFAGHMTSTWRRHLVQHTMLTALLALPNSRSAQLGHPEAIRSGTVRRAVDVIENEESGELSLSDLARMLGVGVRALELGFKQELDTTPSDFLRSSRLERVHAELRLADQQSATVSAIANKWGFAHHGRFASLYRARYGEAPAETLRG